MHSGDFQRVVNLATTILHKMFYGEGEEILRGSKELCQQVNKETFSIALIMRASQAIWTAQSSPRFSLSHNRLRGSPPTAPTSRIKDLLRRTFCHGPASCDKFRRNIPNRQCTNRRPLKHHNSRDIILHLLNEADHGR